MVDAPLEHSFDISRPPALGGGTWNLLVRHPVTVVMGRNGSGKSALLRGLLAYKDRVHYVAPERGGELEYDASQAHQRLEDTWRTTRHSGNQNREFRREAISRVTPYLSVRGAVTAPPDNTSPESFSRILADLLPSFRVTLSSANPPVEIFRTSGERVANVQELSSGEAEVLSGALELLTIAAMWELRGELCQYLLVDEPDIHLHPDLQLRLVEFLVRLTEEYGCRVIIATHSTAILGALHALGKDTTGLLLMKSEQNLRAINLDEYTGELASCLGGSILATALLGTTLLLVEGADDCDLWLRAIRGGKLEVSILPCNGEEIRKYQLALERLAAALAEGPAKLLGYALIDGDVSLPAPGPDNRQAHVQYLQLGCREAENLYLTEEVLADMGLTWAQAKEILAKEPDLLEDLEENRRRSDVKARLPRIVALLDPNKLVWTGRVGKVLGKGRPAGELASFLGEGLVTAVWGVV